MSIRYYGECEAIHANNPDSTPQDTGPTCNPDKWHMHMTLLKTCTNSPDYPPIWDEEPEVGANYMFGHPNQCCGMMFRDDCNIVDECPTSSQTSATEAPLAEESVPEYWHPSTQGPNECVFDSVYEDFMSTPQYHRYYLFSSMEACCAAHNCEDMPSSKPAAIDEPMIPMMGGGGQDFMPLPDEPIVISDPIDQFVDLVSPAGSCTDDSQCQDGLVCSFQRGPDNTGANTVGVCTCNTSTNEGCDGGKICTSNAPGTYCPQGGCLPSCSCNYTPSAKSDGSNGCATGEVCRMPCAMADAGPMCFANEEERDCEVYADVNSASKWVCRDVNLDGRIDFMDGGAGCVERPVLIKVPAVGQRKVDPDAVATTDAAAAERQEYWFPEMNTTERLAVCVLGTNYPEDFYQRPQDRLFDTEEECMNVWAGVTLP